MSKIVTAGTSLISSLAALATLAAQADTQQAFNTVCLWNDTAQDLAYELNWHGVQMTQGTVQKGLWKSHALILQNPNSHLVPAYVRFKATAGSDAFTDWVQLTPQRTTTKTCTLLRHLSLHYTFSGDSAIEPGVRISGPAVRPQAIRP